MTTDSKIYELRTYYPKPGKFEDLQARFRDHTVDLFAKHGIKIVNFWKSLDGEEERLVYTLSFDSKATADEAWHGFHGDPDWIAAKAASEHSGLLTDHIDSVFLVSTDFAPKGS